MKFWRHKPKIEKEKAKQKLRPQCKHSPFYHFLALATLGMDDATLMESFINDVLMAINIDGVNLANAAGPHLILSFNAAPYKEWNSK